MGKLFGNKLFKLLASALGARRLLMKEKPGCVEDINREQPCMH